MLNNAKIIHGMNDACKRCNKLKNVNRVTHFLNVFSFVNHC